MKAILIARISTTEQKEAGNSLPAQVARLEKYCHSKGFEIFKVCSFDESAYTDQRDEFDCIIDFVIAQKKRSLSVVTRWIDCYVISLINASPFCMNAH